MSLTEYLAGLGSPQPFDWARNNCCSFAAQWVKVREGRDPMEGLSDTPGPLQALRLVRDLGGTLEAAWTARLARSPIEPTLAQIGDVVLVPADGPVGAAAGICAGSEAVFLGQDGEALFVPMRFCTHAWRIA